MQYLCHSQAKLEGGVRPSYNPSVESDSTVTLTMFDSDSIPLTTRTGGPYPFKQSAYSSDYSNLHAPRPQAPGQVPIFRADPYDTSSSPYEEYGHDYRNSSPPARQSTDEVSWDMHTPRVAHAEPFYSSPLSASTETIQQGGRSYVSPLNSVRPHASPFLDPEPLHIPTHQSDPMPDRSSPHEHMQEPLNHEASYVTSLTSSPTPAPPRALSPPPPSYRSGPDYLG